MEAEKLRKDIAEILQGADLSQLSARKVRIQLEEKYGTNLTEKKGEIDEIVMEELDKLEEKKDEKTKEQNGNANKRKRGSEDEDDDDSDDSDDAIETKTPKKTEADEDIARQLQEEEEDNCLRRTRHSNKKRVEKKEKKPRKKGVPRENSFTETCNLSPELAAIVGEEKMKRSDVVKKMWAIVKEKNLFDPKNKRFMICDEQMLSVFGKKRVLLFGMMKHLTNHIYKNEEVIAS